jgi:hypothetical protein
METARLRDGVLALLGIGVGVGALLLVPSQIPGGSLGDILEPSSSSFFPIVVAGAMVLCCVVLLANAILCADTDNEPPPALLTQGYIQGSALLTAYVFLVSWIGMLVASGLMIVSLSYAFGYRNWPYMIATAVLMPLSIWFVFRKLLYVVFPSGVLF